MIGEDPSKLTVARGEILALVAANINSAATECGNVARAFSTDIRTAHNEYLCAVHGAHDLFAAHANVSA
jgi:hypothetical protein